MKGEEVVAGRQNPEKQRERQTLRSKQRLKAPREQTAAHVD